MNLTATGAVRNRHRDVETPPMCSASTADRGKELTSHTWLMGRYNSCQKSGNTSELHIHSVCFFSSILTNFIPYLECICRRPSCTFNCSARKKTESEELAGVVVVTGGEKEAED